MTEFTKGIFEVSRDVYKNNKGSILRTIVYTIGHFAIAITVLMLIADVPLMIALTDAIVEPIAGIAIKQVRFLPIYIFAQKIKTKPKAGRLVDHMKSFLNEFLPLIIG